MKFSRFSFCLVILIHLCNIVAAQPYSIRVTYNSNLRASYSLESRVVATVPAGSTLQVIGRFNRWLNISRNGNFWMADWVPHTRVNGGAASSDINNCCFVDRQCSGDQEWVNGYWSFQRNECPLGHTSPDSTGAKPIGSAPAETDNCCFTGWQCHNDADWNRGYWAFQNNQCGAGAPTSSVGRHGGLVIEGSESFQTWVNAGLDLLRRKAPQWYSYVIEATRTIKELPYGAGAGVYVESRTHVTAWGVDWVPSDLNIFTIAHEMIHEACHIYQYLSGNPNWYPAEPWREEKECVEKELEAAQVIDPYDRFGRHSYWRHIIANIEHDRSIWWWD